MKKLCRFLNRFFRFRYPDFIGDEFTARILESWLRFYPRKIKIPVNDNPALMWVPDDHVLHFPEMASYHFETRYQVGKGEP